MATSTQAADFEFDFWVWNRVEVLTPNERTQLRAAGIKKLFWQVGELEIHDGKFVLRRTANVSFVPPDQAEADPQIVPTVRVSTAIRSPEVFSGDALGQALRPVADAAPGREVQLDFDCPTRLLPVYAERLRSARQIAGLRRLTITALAGWADAPEAQTLWPTVDAVYPMLYDTQTDPAPVPGNPIPCQPRPLLDPAELDRRLHRWQTCPVPWYPGLPTFARVTLYEPTGRSRGHVRAWDWEDLVFNPAWMLDRPVANGTVVLRARQATRLGGSAVAAGSYAAVRAPERMVMRAGIAQARAAGARGAVLFRLPDPPAPLRPTGGGWSLPQTLALLSPNAVAAAAPPHLSLRHAEDGGDRWRLCNESDQDLPARFGPGERGYSLELELDGETPGWREALPGEFQRVVGHVPAGANADGSLSGKPAPVAIPLARRLTFWFADLPAHGTLATGLVQLAPGVDPAKLRFRVLPADPAAPSLWQRPD